MDKDYVRELGCKALDSRFKRISDRITHDIRRFYKEIDVEIEPNWYLVFRLIRDHESLSIAALAERLGYSHPAAVTIVQKMAKKGYVKTRKHRTDRRVQMITLTMKSTELISSLETIWAFSEDVLLEILNNDFSILAHLDQIDDSLRSKSFYSRLISRYSMENNSST